MHISQSMRSCAIRMVPCVLAMAGVTSMAIAGIESGKFKHGEGNISYNPATQTYTIKVNNSAAIIEYTNFDIASGRIVNFIQPGVTSRVLNRVDSNDPTMINGALNANGVVYLTNPAGIVFGNGAAINTSQFYAAAGEIENHHFLSGNDLFTNLSGNVVNMGTITAENAVHLIGRRIINHGTIDVTGIDGVVTLTASDHAVHISGSSSQYMVTIANAPGGAHLGGIGVDNSSSGVIQTGAGGRIRLGAGDVYSMAIQAAGPGISAANVNFDSPTYIDGQAVIHGNTEFTSTVDTARRSAPATLQVIGDATFQDSVGNARALQSLEVIGDTTMNGGLVFTEGEQSYRGTMTLHSDTKLVSNVAGNISVSGEVDGAHSFLVDTDGTIFLLSAVGDNIPLDTLVLIGDGKAVLSGKSITTENNQNYFVHVELADHMDMLSANGNIMLTSTVDGATYNLTLDAVESHIQGEVSDVNLLTTRGSGSVHIGADISVLDGMRFENAVALTDSVKLSNIGSGDIAFLSTIDGEHALLVTTNNGDVRFGGNVGGDNPLASLETIVGGTIFFGADLVQTVGDILLNEQVNLIAVPAVATIGAEGNIAFISANGDFVMGHKQKLTALGHILIEAANGTATLGDLHAFGDIFVDANAILLLARDAANVMLPDGTFMMDNGLDFVATGSFNFSVAPVLIGTGPSPQFVSLTANPDQTGNLSGFDVITTDEALPLSRFLLLPETYLDPLVGMSGGPGDPGGPGGEPGPGTPGPGPQPQIPETTRAPIEQANLATALGGAMYDLDETEIKDSLNIDPTDRTGLAIMGVRVREVGRDDLTGYVDGRAVYDDLQLPSLDGPVHQQPLVSINRIHRGLLHRALRHFDRTLMYVTYDPETGDIIGVRARDNEIADALSMLRSEHASASPDELSQIVREHDAELASVFAAMQELPSELASMGLSAHEADEALNAVLERIARAVDGLSTDDLSHMVRRSAWRPI